MLLIVVVNSSDQIALVLPHVPAFSTCVCVCVCVCAPVDATLCTHVLIDCQDIHQADPSLLYILRRVFCQANLTGSSIIF